MARCERRAPASGPARDPLRPAARVRSGDHGSGRAGGQDPSPREPWRDDSLGRALSKGFDRPGAALPSKAVWRRIEREIAPRPNVVERALTRIFGRGLPFGTPSASFAASVGAVAIGAVLGTMSVGVILSGGGEDYPQAEEPVLVAGLSLAEAEIQPLIDPVPVDRTAPAGPGPDPMRWIRLWPVEQRIRLADGPFEPRCEAFEPYRCSGPQANDASVAAGGSGAPQRPALSDPITPQPAVRF